jgi:formylglycine-generating enzyme required for sulfatase activity
MSVLVPGWVYIVGPSHNLMARRIERPVIFDRYTVTVAQYLRFLEAVDHNRVVWMGRTGRARSGAMAPELRGMSSAAYNGGRITGPGSRTGTEYAPIHPVEQPTLNHLETTEQGLGTSGPDPR